MSQRYALVGTGSRAGMFVEALTTTYADSAELVALCDLSHTRMNWYNRQIAALPGRAPLPTYHATQFDQMIAQTRPDTIIVTTIDSTHHLYITRAMELGCDVITEKPMTMDLPKLCAIFDTIQHTGRSLRVTFNYRYAPAYTRFHELIASGVIGRPLLVDFSWLLDTSHGADYFRRWHREKDNSGGLLVHKATHHFDLVNWWINSFPQSVFALGALHFYGRQNAAARGQHYPYHRYTGVPAAQNDPFALFLDTKESLRELYLEAEAETGYLRDRNVFGEPITIEDTMTVTARYHNGVLLSYCLVAYAPWEGLRVAVTGTKGRVELDIEETVTHLLSDAQIADAQATELQASKGPFKQSTLRVIPHFQPPYHLDIPVGYGGHGGADRIMLEQLFSPNPPPDPYHRAATHLDGAASILTGIAANQSIATGRPVHIDDLFPLSTLMRHQGAHVDSIS